MDLVRALKEEYYDRAIELIGSGIELNMTYDGLSPLHLAVYKRKLDIVKLMIDHGIDVNFSTGYQWSCNPAIHTAIKYGDQEMVELLIRSGANLGSHRLMSCAIRKTRYKIFKMLLDMNCHYDGALIDATRSRSMRMIRDLVEKGLDVDHRDYNGCTALHVVGRVEIARYLIDHDIDVNALDRGGRTALYYKLSSPSVSMYRDVINFLIPLTDLNLKTRDGTCLEVAIKKNLLPEVRQMIVIPQELNQSQMIHLAVTTKNLEMVQLILPYVSRGALNSGYQTPLELAIKNGELEMIKLLVRSGAEVTQYLVSMKLASSVNEYLKCHLFRTQYRQQVLYTVKYFQKKQITPDHLYILTGHEDYDQYILFYHLAKLNSGVLRTILEYKS